MSAVQGLVSGQVQKVGFRAFILRQAVAGNLSGWTVNLSDGRVSFCLAGPAPRIQSALEEIARGPDRSKVAGVQTWPVPYPPGPQTFTVCAWTSESRKITTPYNLVFSLRSPDSVLSKKKADKFYHRLLEESGLPRN